MPRPDPTINLTDAEKRDLIGLIQSGKALPEKYRFLLFEDKREVELVWNGKTRDVCTTVLPFQTLEHVDEPRPEAKTSPQFELFDARGRQAKGWTNKLIWGDNKLILSSLKSGPLREQIEEAGGLKLIYIDPPFDVGADFSMDIEIGGETFHKEPNILEQIAYRDTWGRGADSFIAMIYERLILMRDLLAADGSIYVHMGPGVAYAVEAAIREVFGISGASSTMAWKRVTAHGDSLRWGLVHDAVLWRTKSERFIWNPQFEPYSAAYTDGKYKVQQSAVDGKGNLYLLLINESPTNTSKDTLLKPWILSYDFRENKFAEHKVNFPNSSVPEGCIHITREGELIFSGILSDGSANGFLNGAKAFPTALKWNKISLKKFNISRELTLTTEYTIELPEALLKRYSANGANFSKSMILDQGKQIYWILEENWTQIHNKELQFLFYDIAVVAFDIETGKIDWANFFEKKQRDYRSGNLLSYVPGIASGKLNFVYLSERGAQGKILASAFDLKTGVVAHKELVSNFNSDFLFFPKRSGMVTPQSMILMGVGRPNENEYKLIRIIF